MNKEQELSELKNVLDNIPKNFNSKINNLFSVGTKGFYENPFTEVLAYILKKESNYKFRDQFLRVLLKDLNDDKFVESIISSCKVNTQFTTNNGNYIDLLIYNHENIIVFENKIHHWLANPFTDYENDISNKFPRHNKKFIILSYKKEECPSNWIYINIRKTFDKIINLNLHKFDNKWDYFVNDFLIQFSNSKLFNMDKSYFDFYEQNFSKIVKANAELKDFIIDIAEKITEEVEINRYKYSDWGKYERAIRFYPFENENNVTLIFKENGTYGISIYYYDRYDFKLKINEYIGISEYESWNEGSICCYTKLPGNEYDNLENALKELKLQMEKQKKYYK